MDKVIVAPTLEVLSTSEVAAHLRLGDSPWSDESVLSLFIVAVREWTEEYIRRTIGVQTRELILDKFPDGMLLRAPVHSITSVQYIDPDGVLQTLSASAYALDDVNEPAWLVPAYSYSWPDTRGVINAVRVRYSCGYTDGGSSPAKAVPKSIIAAMLLMIGDLYENREAQVVGQVNIVNNPTVERLLHMYRLELGV